MLDNRVSVWLKLIPLVGLAYLISPISLILNLIPVLGQLDDIVVICVAILLFNQLAPADVVADHLVRLRYQPLPPRDEPPSEDVIIMDSDDDTSPHEL